MRDHDGVEQVITMAWCAHMNGRCAETSMAGTPLASEPGEDQIRRGRLMSANIREAFRIFAERMSFAECLHLLSCRHPHIAIFARPVY